MKLFIVILLLSIHLLASGQDIESYQSFDDYMEHLVTDDSKVYVVNYWATWCAPCVKEMPYFEQLNEAHQEVEVVFVSIDFANQYEKRLVPFVEKRNLQSRIIHMTDPKTNVWIDKVNPDWSGAIPATQIIKGDQQLFLERSFESLAELEEVVQPFLK